MWEIMRTLLLTSHSYYLFIFCHRSMSFLRIYFKRNLSSISLERKRCAKCMMKSSINGSRIFNYENMFSYPGTFDNRFWQNQGWMKKGSRSIQFNFCIVEKSWKVLNNRLTLLRLYCMDNWEPLKVFWTRSCGISN
jgi:hypothetical protein